MDVVSIFAPVLAPAAWCVHHGRRRRGGCHKLVDPMAELGRQESCALGRQSSSGNGVMCGARQGISSYAARGAFLILRRLVSPNATGPHHLSHGGVVGNVSSALLTDGRAGAYLTAVTQAAAAVDGARPPNGW